MRGALGLSLAAALPTWPRAGRADTLDFASEWQAFRDRYMTPDGRVVDTGNDNISHTEGQGVGMLFSEAAADRNSFERIYAWTSAHLARPSDALHKWRYVPGAANPTADPNNATDGDILIAWALARAGLRWGEPRLSTAAAAIAGDILDKLCVEQSGQLFLLPGIAGFETKTALDVNPSYYIFPAFGTLALLSPSDVWDRLRMNGLDMLQKALFGSWHLPPDWLAVSRPTLGLAPASAWPPRFGFDAIRVPLWLTWAGMMPAGMSDDFKRCWESPAFPYRPAWIDLANDTYADYAAPSGMQAVMALTLAARDGEIPQLPPVEAATDYYSATLTLLSRMALYHREMAEN